MPVVVTGVQSHPYRQTIQAGNHTFYADVPKAKGGQDSAPSPHDLLLGALGACTSMTMQMLANRKGWDLQQVTVSLEERAVKTGNGLRPVSLVTKAIQVKGNLSPDQLDRLKSVAERCPVNQLLLGDKQVQSSFDHIA